MPAKKSSKKSELFSENVWRVWPVFSYKKLSTGVLMSPQLEQNIRTFVNTFSQHVLGGTTGRRSRPLDGEIRNPIVFFDDSCVLLVDK